MKKPFRPATAALAVALLATVPAHAAAPLDSVGAETMIGLVDALETLPDVRALLDAMT